jgi:hypothetical protein
MRGDGGGYDWHQRWIGGRLCGAGDEGFSDSETDERICRKTKRRKLWE